MLKNESIQRGLNSEWWTRIIMIFINTADVFIERLDRKKEFRWDGVRLRRRARQRQKKTKKQRSTLNQRSVWIKQYVFAFIWIIN